MVQIFLEKKCLALLATRDRTSSRSLLFDEAGLLKGWINKQTQESILHKSLSSLNEKAFSGIQVIDSRIFKLLPKEGKFSITPHYIQLSKSHEILAFDHNHDFWFDIGKPQTLSDACQFFETYPNIDA